MGDEGIFGPRSAIWRVNREGVLLLGGGRALILQVAHPLVAAGVAEHSNYREDPWGRLYRTLDTVLKMVFGPTEVAREAGERLARVHSRIRGTTTEPGGRFPAGTLYEASDPELLMWVHATLVDTAMLVYTRYVGPMSPVDEERYYADQMLLGEQFGIPRERQPQTLPDFRDYFSSMLASDEIAVTDALRDVTDATMHPPLPLATKPVVEALNLATVGLLPEALRDDLGLPWGPRRERMLDASRQVLRRALPLLPSLLRDMPPARAATNRTRTREKTPILGKLGREIRIGRDQPG